MASLFTGQQMHAFFQDSDFWGNGQSFHNLRLKIDGRLVGADDFAAGWDPSDIPEDAIVKVLDGQWDGRGFTLANHSMPAVIEDWKKGIKPMPACQPAAPAHSEKGLDRVGVENLPARPQFSGPALDRPSFMRPKPQEGASPPKIKRPVFSC